MANLKTPTTIVAWVGLAQMVVHNERPPGVGSMIALVVFLCLALLVIVFDL